MFFDEVFGFFWVFCDGFLGLFDGLLGLLMGCWGFFDGLMGLLMS